MKKNGFAGILIILVIAVLGIIGYFAYKNYQAKPQISVVLTPSPLADSGSTANWKTYTNTQIGFSLKYPDSLLLENFYDSSTGLPDKNVVFGFEFRDQQTKFPKFLFTVYKAGDKKLFPPTPSEALNSKIGSLSVISFQDSGMKFIRFPDATGRIFQLGVSATSPENDKTADQILSTFKFTK